MIATLLLFLSGTLVILFAGTRLAKIADQLADRSGMGEAITGALFLGGMTSLPGLIASVTGAWNGYPEMAVSNAIGGIAAQTVFIVIADFIHKEANLEHAAASHTNLFQGSLLITLLAMPLLAANHEIFSTWRVHPVSLLMLVIYMGGLRVASNVRSEAMWKPRQTSATHSDDPDSDNQKKSLNRLVASFCVLGLLTALAGWAVGRAGISMISEAGWKETIVGGIFTAISSSLPELVTTIAAVHRRAYTLAVSGIVGGNAFDTLFVAASDIAYSDGSIYHHIGSQQQFMVAMAIAMTAILLAGLVRRERSGIANVGSEGILLLVCYGIFLAALIT